MYRPEEIKSEPPPDTKPGRSWTTCNADSAFLPLRKRQIKDTIKIAEIQRKTHLCEKTAQVRFAFSVLPPVPAVPGQNAQKRGGKFGGREKEKFKQSI